MFSWALFLLACGSQSPAPKAEVPAPPILRFAAVGDAGKGNAAQAQVAGAIARVCKERGCDFVLLLGDNLYPAGLDSPTDPRMTTVFSEMYADVPAPFYATLGNHDYGHPWDGARAQHQVDWAKDVKNFHLPSKSYDATIGAAHLWSLDTTAILKDGPEAQNKWLASTVRSATQPWKIAFGHHPYRSNGPHGNAGNYDARPGAGSALQGLINEHLCATMDLYISGHDHSLQWLEHCGMGLIVSGAGAALYPLVHQDNQPLFAASQLGFSFIELLEDHYRVSFFDEKAQLLFSQTQNKRSVQPSSP